MLANTETGREIARENLEKSIRAALRARYGDIADLADLARRLAETDSDGNIARIVNGATLDELRA